jgi:regulator of RNase E activity RraB
MSIRCIFFTIVLASFTISSCKKAEDRRCYKFAGADAQKEILLENFHALDLGKKLEYVFINDSTNKVVLVGKENLLNLVEIQNSNDTLYIDNHNKCDYFRKFKNNKIRVEIHYTELKYIYSEASEPLICLDTLKTETLQIEIRDGAGSSNFLVKVENISIDAPHGWGDYLISGQAANAYIGIRSNCFADVTNLKVTNYYYIAHESQGDLKVNPNNLVLYGYLKAGGNILYTGQFVGESMVKTGKGKIKPL